MTLETSGPFSLTIYPDPGEPRFCAKCAASLEAKERGGRLRPHCPRCSWTYFAKPALGAAALIETDGCILLVQRAENPYKGFWMLPAGFVEYDEYAKIAAEREVEEETGLKVAIGEFFGLYWGTDDPRNPSHLAVYRAQVVGGTPQPGDDASSLAWFSHDSLPGEIAFAGQREAIADWAAARKRALGQ